MKHLKGFTIVELLVVVSILAVLASIVFVNVSVYINKGKNAAIKSNLSTALVNSAVYADTNHSYNGFCFSSGLTGPAAAVKGAGGSDPLPCIESTDKIAFCACSKLLNTVAEPTGSTLCIDSTGNKKITQIDCDTECSTDGACI